MAFARTSMSRALMVGAIRVGSSGRAVPFAGTARSSVSRRRPCSPGRTSISRRRVADAGAVRHALGDQSVADRVPQGAGARLSTAIEKDNGRSLFSLTPYARHNVLDIMPSWQLTFNQQIWDTRNNSVGMLAKYRRDFDPMRTRVIVGADLDYSPGSFLANKITSTATGGIFQAYTTGDKQYDYDVTYRQASPYVHTEFSPVGRLRLDAGVRYDASGYVYDTKLDPIATGRWRRPADTTVNYTRLSPKFGATLDSHAA